jgi:hypothetical protein
MTRKGFEPPGPPAGGVLRTGFNWSASGSWRMPLEAQYMRALGYVGWLVVDAAGDITVGFRWPIDSS